MRVLFEDLQIGDEIIIPSNSNLRYLKVLKKNRKSYTCSTLKGKVDIHSDYAFKDKLLEPDVSKHNSTFHLLDEGNYRDIWLVRRGGSDG